MTIARFLKLLGPFSSLTGCEDSTRPNGRLPKWDAAPQDAEAPETSRDAGDRYVDAGHDVRGETCLDEDLDGTCAEVDCDDLNFLTFPGADEVPGDGRDNDCDGETDEEVRAGGSGHGGSAGTRPNGVESPCVDLDLDGVCKGEGPDDDCDDGDRAIPGIEICDGKDNDCNGEIDEGLEACDPNRDAGRRRLCEEEPPPLQEGPLTMEWSCEEGQTENCGTCDFGTRVCVGGLWGACDYRPPQDQAGLEGCACHVVDIFQNPPGILLVLDISGSMNELYLNGIRKYEAATSAINAALDIYAGQADFGIEVFPSIPNCGVEPAQVPVGGEPDAIRRVLQAWHPNGGTPLTAAVNRATEELRLYRNNHPDRIPSAILLSDGGESCSGGADWLAPPIAALNRLQAAGNRVFLLDASGGVLGDIGRGLDRPLDVYDVTAPEHFLESLEDIMTRLEVSVPYREEICNGVDDDCDGQVDEGFLSFYYGGPDGTLGVGSCSPGVRDCVAGRFGTTVPPVLPEVDICDRQDNDCDGETDECFRVLEPCKWFQSRAEVAASPCGHKQTLTTCTADGVMTCEPPVPAEEVCNGVDDDCDGVVDNVAGRECGGAEGEGEDGPVPAPMIEPGLVHRWSFDLLINGHVPNLAGPNHFGVLFNGAALGAGVSGAGLHLDGRDDYLATRGGALQANPLPVGISREWTISAWVRPAEERLQTLWTLGDKSNDPWRDYIEVLTNGTDLFLNYYDEEGNLSQQAAGHGTISIGEWQHLAFTMRGNEPVAFYRNGRPVLTRVLGNGAFGEQNDSPRWISLGRELDAARYVAGDFDEFRIHDYAMDAGAVLALCRREDPGNLCQAP